MTTKLWTLQILLDFAIHSTEILNVLYPYMPGIVSKRASQLEHQ